MSLCVCIWVYECIHMCMYVGRCIYVHAYTLHVCMHTCVYVCINIYMYIGIHVYVYIMWMYVHKCTYLRHAYVSVHVCMYGSIYAILMYTCRYVYRQTCMSLYVYMIVTAPPPSKPNISQRRLRPSKSLKKTVPGLSLLLTRGGHGGDGQTGLLQ